MKKSILSFTEIFSFTKLALLLVTMITLYLGIRHMVTWPTLIGSDHGYELSSYFGFSVNPNSAELLKKPDEIYNTPTP